MINVKISDIKEICKLSKKTKKQLQKLNPHGAFISAEHTKHQLIYQIVFLRDAPKI